MIGTPSWEIGPSPAGRGALSIMAGALAAALATGLDFIVETAEIENQHDLRRR